MAKKGKKGRSPTIPRRGPGATQEPRGGAEASAGAADSPPPARNTLYATKDQTRFFSIPDVVKLPEGELVIGSLTGKLRRVEPRSVQAYEVPEAWAMEAARGEMTEIARNAGKFLSSAVSTLRAAAAELGEEPTQTAEVNEEPTQTAEVSEGPTQTAETNPDPAEAVSTETDPPDTSEAPAEPADHAVNDDEEADDDTRIKIERSIAGALGISLEDFQEEPELVLDALAQTFRGMTKTIKQGLSENPADQETVQQRMQAIGKQLREQGREGWAERLEDLPRQVRDYLANPELEQQIDEATEKLRHLTQTIDNMADETADDEDGDEP